MSLGAKRMLDRLAACLALSAVWFGPAAAAEEAAGFRDLPQLQGAWEIFLDYSNDNLTGYVGALVFTGERFQRLSQDETASNPALIDGSFRVLDTGPGTIRWQAKAKLGPATLQATSQFLSADVALTDWGPNQQRVILLRSPCDYRFADAAAPAIDGCAWTPVSGAWLQEARRVGDCGLSAPCFRLVSRLAVAAAP